MTTSGSPTQPAPMLTACGVRKSYDLGRRTVEVLRGVDLAIPRGSFMALQGASGAGKSTLLHILGGLDQPLAGEVTFNGENLARLSARALARYRNGRVGFVGV